METRFEDFDSLLNFLGVSTIDEAYDITDEVLDQVEQRIFEMEDKVKDVVVGDNFYDALSDEDKRVYNALSQT